MFSYIFHLDMSLRYFIFYLSFSLYCYILLQNDCACLFARCGIVESLLRKPVGNGVCKRNFLKPPRRGSKLVPRLVQSRSGVVTVDPSICVKDLAP